MFCFMRKKNYFDWNEIQLRSCKTFAFKATRTQNCFKNCLLSIAWILLIFEKKET